MASTHNCFELSGRSWYSTNAVELATERQAPWKAVALVPALPICNIKIMTRQQFMLSNESGLFSAPRSLADPCPTR